jgi:hypothetical protein
LVRAKSRRGPSLVLGGVHRWVLIECSSAFCPLPVARVIADGGDDVSVCPA